MRIQHLNNRAFSLLEVLLAAIIFVTTVAGVFATLNAVRAPVINKEGSLTAVVFGKQVLDTLRSKVNATTFYNACPVIMINGDGSCGDFSLFLGLHEVSTAVLATYGINSLPPTFVAQNPNGLSYTVSCADGSPSPCSSPDVARRVDLNIQW